MALPLNSAAVYSKVHEWLEWEQTVLKPAVYSENGTVGLSEALEVLDKALSASHERFLIGTEHSLADIAIFSTLFHLREDNVLPGGVQAYLEALSLLAPFKNGVQNVRLQFEMHR